MYNFDDYRERHKMSSQNSLYVNQYKIYNNIFCAKLSNFLHSVQWLKSFFSHSLSLLYKH